jgi:hypothetical protein
LADEYAFELIELTAMTCAAISSKASLAFLTGRRSRRDHGNSHQAAARPIKHFGTQLFAALFNNGDAI